MGQLLFTVTLWIAGVVQGAMWKATNPDGSLVYTFLDSVAAMYPYWAVRLLGGLLYFAGIAVFAYNLYMTSRLNARAVWPMKIDSLYEKPVLFALAAVVVISIGTLVTTFVPLFLPSTQPTSPLFTPYTAIETEGRDIYIREGCNNCHTQTVRPMRSEVARYGDYSRPEESAWDRPFLWGSRRTGPDLARSGGKYPDTWHYRHMANPQGMFDKSNMPAYPELAKSKLDTSLTVKKVKSSERLRRGGGRTATGRLPPDGHRAGVSVRAGALPGDAGRPSRGEYGTRRAGRYYRSWDAT